MLKPHQAAFSLVQILKKERLSALHSLRPVCACKGVPVSSEPCRPSYLRWTDMVFPQPARKISC
jgi:hypothetical protein